MLLDGLRSPPFYVEALLEFRVQRAKKHRRHQSFNQTVLDLLHQGLGLNSPETRSNGLRNLAGNWNEEEFREFQEELT